ncbi:unnamed protein product [Vitrella brassicaformis CCMP3155]|uniref:Uncharacterized protein n=1 Tax=Vitrella brassicaformis (strain CCMP3155) TaxID=1169540 RepID=A0A0G4E964_VITBC|nr:unnamed protein product [Vitrella brassicaformis CCMP3155]|eukprot:CEL91767.1 unnamed protein product [Vitrella brassicaformis CCMP3155]
MQRVRYRLLGSGGSRFVHRLGVSQFFSFSTSSAAYSSGQLTVLTAWSNDTDRHRAVAEIARRHLSAIEQRQRQRDADSQICWLWFYDDRPAHNNNSNSNSSSSATHLVEHTAARRDDLSLAFQTPCLDETPYTSCSLIIAPSIRFFSTPDESFPSEVQPTWMSESGGIFLCLGSRTSNAYALYRRFSGLFHRTAGILLHTSSPTYALSLPQHTHTDTKDASNGAAGLFIFAIDRPDDHHADAFPVLAYRNRFDPIQIHSSFARRFFLPERLAEFAEKRATRIVSVDEEEKGRAAVTSAVRLNAFKPEPPTVADGQFKRLEGVPVMTYNAPSWPQKEIYLTLFEPRYRVMFKHAIDRCGGLFGFIREGFSIGCLVAIEGWAFTTSDYQVMLKGTATHRFLLGRRQPALSDAPESFGLCFHDVWVYDDTHSEVEKRQLEEQEWVRRDIMPSIRARGISLAEYSFSARDESSELVLASTSLSARLQFAVHGDAGLSRLQETSVFARDNLPEEVVERRGGSE